MEERKVNRLRILLLANSIYFFSYFQRIAVPGTVFNELQSEFSLSATGVAGLASLTFLIYGGMQIFSGMTSDRFGGFRTFLTGGLLLALSSILFSFSHSPAMLFIMRMFVGFSASFIFISLVKILTVVYDSEDFPMFLSISLMLGYSGGVFATYPLERAVSCIGWRNAFLIAGLLCAVFAAACVPVLTKARKIYLQEKTFSLRALFEVLRNRHSGPVVISGAINYGVYMLFQTTIGKKYLQDSFNIASSQASFFTFVMMITNVCFSFIAGYTSRLTGLRRPILLVATSITLASAIMLFLNAAFAGSAKLVLFSYVLLAVSSAVTPVYMTAMKEINAVEVVSTSIGFFNSISYLFVAFIGYASGRILDAFGHSAVEIAGIVIYPCAAYKTVCLVCVMLALLSFLLCFSIKETGNGKPS